MKDPVGTEALPLFEDEAYQAGQEDCIAPIGAASGDVAGKASIKLNTSDGEIYRSFFDSNRILGRP